MTAPKVGDRVRVTYEGTYDRAFPNGREMVHEIRSGGRFVLAPPDAKFEILRPPVTVGDVIETAEQLDALPQGSAVLFGDYRIAKKYGRDWYETGSESACLVAELIPAKVLLLPDGAA